MGISGLQRRIEQSRLSEDDKDIWLRAMELMDDDEAQVFLDAIEEDPHELEVLTRNLKLKKVAFATHDTALLGQVVEDELEDISGASHE